MRQIRFHPLAVLEMEAAAEYYLKIQPKLDARFVEELEYSIALLRQFPQMGSPLSKNLKKHSLHSFPYNLIYLDQPHENTLVIFALAHHARQPDYWTGR